MKRIAWILLALGLVATGCILTSGQIQISFDLPGVVASSTTGIVGHEVNLNDESEYKDNKDKLKSLSDFAVLGKFVNNSGSPVDVEVWMTTDASSFTDKTAMEGSSKALKLWGPFTVPANGTRVVDWNDSAKLFTAAGKAAILSEAKGPEDGDFTLYAVGNAGTYDFSVDNGVLVLVIDAGI
jgi:hypothetical protein